MPWNVYLRNKKMWEAYRTSGFQEPFVKEGPTFTFADSAHLQDYVTGTRALLQKLLNGHEVEQAALYVPFSNGTQWGDPTSEPVLAELRSLTTIEDAWPAFGVTVVPSNAETYEDIAETHPVVRQPQPVSSRVIQDQGMRPKGGYPNLRDPAQRAAATLPEIDPTSPHHAGPRA